MSDEFHVKHPALAAVLDSWDKISGGTTPTTDRIRTAVGLDDTGDTWVLSESGAWMRDEVHEISHFELHEVSLVTEPANPNARIISVTTAEED